MKRLLLNSGTVVLALCAGVASAAPTAIDSALPAPAGQLAAPAGVPAAAAPATRMMLPRPQLRATRHAGMRRRSPALARVGAANRSALQEPSRAGYAGAVQVYPWVEGSLYRLYTAPEQVSDIALQPGEALVSVAAGDTVRWVIGDTASGAGASRRVHVLVKPSAPALATNLIIATDRRVYHIELESSAGGAMASIAWTYPEDALLALRAAQAAAEAAPVAEGLEIDRLSFDYAIGGDRPPWRPVRAFDDGRQLFIELPAGVAAGEAPPLFVRGEKGEAQLVNYRLRGRYYVVDRLFAAAELRLGEGKKQTVVTIVRIGASGVGRHRGRRS